MPGVLRTHAAWCTLSAHTDRVLAGAGGCWRALCDPMTCPIHVSRSTRWMRARRSGRRRRYPGARTPRSTRSSRPVHSTESCLTRTATSTLFWTSSHVVLSITPPHALVWIKGILQSTHPVWGTPVRYAHAHWVLIDACQPMLCPIHRQQAVHRARTAAATAAGRAACQPRVDAEAAAQALCDRGGAAPAGRHPGLLDLHHQPARE